MFDPPGIRTVPNPSDISNGTPRPVYLALLTAVFLIGLGLRLYALDADSLWVDEIFTVTTSRLDLRSLPSFLASTDTHPPMHYVLTKLVVELFGDSEFVLRLSAALLGSVSVLLVYKVGHTLWTPREGLLGAFLLSISAYHIHYSQEARHYSLMVFLALLSLTFLLRALQRGQKRMWVLFALCTILNIYTHDFAFLVLASEVLFAAWVVGKDWLSCRVDPGQAKKWSDGSVGPTADSASSRQPSTKADLATAEPRRPPSPGRQALSLVAALAVIGVCYLPWLPIWWQQLHGSKIEFQGVGVGPAPGTELSFEFVGAALQAYASLNGIPLLLYLALFVIGLARCRARYIVLLATWVTIPFAFLFVVRSVHSLHPRHTLFIVPIFFLGMAKGMSALTSLLTPQFDVARGRRKWHLRLAVVLSASLFGLFSIVPLRNYYVWDKTDLRGAAQYLAARLNPGDLVLVDGTGYLEDDSTYIRSDLMYYMEQIEMSEVRVLPVGPGLAGAMVRSGSGASGGVWAVVYHPNGLTNTEAQDVIITTRFQDLAVVNLRQPSSDTYEDAAMMLNALAELLAASEAHFDIHLALAELYVQMGRGQEAALQVELAKVSEPDDARAHVHLARSYTEQGRPEDAVTEYLLFLQTPWARENTKWQRWAYAGLGEAYSQLNEPAKALAAYEKAMDIDPRDPEFLFLLGEAYQRLGRIEEARLLYQQVLGISPEHKSARTRLRLLSCPVDGEIPYGLLRSLGQQIVLLGYDVSPSTLEAGATVNVILWWQAVAAMDKDYTAFIHLTRPGERVWAQHDSLLADGSRRTSAWQLGVIVREEYQLRVPLDAPGGGYWLTTGVYHWQTGERLPVWDRNGERVPNDTIPLAIVSVRR